jgi:hypothetical protein
MRFTGIANPEQLSILCRAFDEHCRSHGILDEQARDNAATLVMSLFAGGADSLEELTAELAAVSDRHEHRNA